MALATREGLLVFMKLMILSLTNPGVVVEILRALPGKGAGSISAAAGD
jgi:hypothetical protein